MLFQVDQENIDTRSEIDDYEDLVEWLNMADQMLQIIDQPVYDRDAEFSVSFVYVLSLTLNCK